MNGKILAIRTPAHLFYTAIRIMELLGLQDCIDLQKFRLAAIHPPAIEITGTGLAKEDIGAIRRPGAILVTAKEFIRGGNNSLCRRVKECWKTIITDNDIIPIGRCNFPLAQRKNFFQGEWRFRWV